MEVQHYFFFKKWASYRLYRKRPRIVNRTVPKIIVISVHTVNRFPLNGHYHYLIKCDLFSLWYSWKIAHLALHNGHSLTIFFILFQVAIRGGGLGFVFGFGFHLTFSESWVYFGYYIMALTLFHFSEYFTTAVTNPRSLTLSSFLLDHSKEYRMAAAASWTEYIIELFLFPGKYWMYYRCFQFIML